MYLALQLVSRKVAGKAWLPSTISYADIEGSGLLARAAGHKQALW